MTREAAGRAVSRVAFQWRAALLAGAFFSAHAAGEEAKPRPLMRDFIGLCVHTVSFKPELYRPVTSVVRDYHPLKWDVGEEMDFAALKLPRAKNGVEWGKMYGGWAKAGYRIEASIQFDDVKPDAWKDLPRDAFDYGREFARVFGPGSGGPVEAIEVGNEPGKYDDATYRALFEAMARGVRAGDAKMRVATCALNLGKTGAYYRSADAFTGLEALYDIVNIHVYAQVEGWPTWKRSYPEDPSIEFLDNVRHVLKWRDRNAPGKEMWVTEFGWDASTKPAPPSGTFAKWQGSTETQQAQWIVRAYLLMAREGVDRAYLFFFNDKDDAHVHGSSGLTRNYEPKPSFHAVAHLQKTLGDYRFSRVIREDAADCYAYEFQHGSDAKQRVWAVWKPQAEAGAKVRLPGAGKVTKAERTPLAPSDAERVEVTATGGEIEVPVAELPVFVWMADQP